MSPCVLTIGAARFITATPASAPVSPTGPAAGPAHAGHQPGVDATSQHPHHDAQRGLVGDPQAVHLALGDARGRQGRVDLLAAAVHDGQLRRAGQRADALGHPRDVLGAFQQLAAQLDHDAGPCGHYQSPRRCVHARYVIGPLGSGKSIFIHGNA